MKIGKTITAAWDPVENTYIDYYEVRLDSNVGQSNSLLAKTTDIRSEIKLSARRGAVFIYAHNPVKDMVRLLDLTIMQQYLKLRRMSK